MKPLTPFEIRVLKFSAEGLTYPEIARLPEIRQNPGSIRNTASRIMEKLGANNITHAVYLAIKSGVIGF